MNLKHLYYFWKVAKHGGVVRAAIDALCHIAPDQITPAPRSPEDLAAFYAALRASLSPGIPRSELTCHINAPEFVTAALAVFDDWVARGIVPAPMGQARRIPA